MTHSFSVAGGTPANLDDIANQLREQIDGLPPDKPQPGLMKRYEPVRT